MSHAFTAAPYPHPSTRTHSLQSVVPGLREVSIGRYVFIWRKATKRFTHNKETIDRILRVWRGTVAGKNGAPWVIAGDEATYRFMYHLQLRYPREYSQIRRYQIGTSSCT